MCIRWWGVETLNVVILSVVLINFASPSLQSQDFSVFETDNFLPCISKDFGKGSIVCKCNSTYCDIPPKIFTPSQFPKNLSPDSVQVYTSTKNGQRFKKSYLTFSKIDKLLVDERKSRPRRFLDTILQQIMQAGKRRFSRGDIGDGDIIKFKLNHNKKFQAVLGIGGSFTDSAGLNIKSLSPQTQENLMKSYFGEDGNDYNMGRVPMGGTDFSARPYTLDDVSFPDKNLTFFSLQPEDYELKIPYIKLAQKLMKGKELHLVASPWSAPVWMKTNKKLNGAGLLRKEFYQTWANYFVKFIDSYKTNGIPIWGVTTGNEPFNGFVLSFPFNSMGWYAADMSTWIAKNLGPTLKAYSPKNDIKIIIMDDSKIHLPRWSKQILGDKRSAKYVYGVGTHWYFDFLTTQDILSRFHESYPDYFIIQTEACLGFTPWEREKVIIGSWERGESYLGAIINDMKNWVGGWIDWNLALSMEGGPNWVDWKADAAILVNSKTDEFYKQPIFYAIGHMSKFVPKGSQRVELSSLNAPKELDYVAFLRPDNGTVVIFMNKLEESVRVSISDELKGVTYFDIPQRAMKTLIYW